MKILVVSFFFPPYNGIAPVRLNKTARYLMEFGHELRVVTAGNQTMLQKNLPLEIPEEFVTWTKWWNVYKPVLRFTQQASGDSRSSNTNGMAVESAPARGSLMPAFKRWLFQSYTTVVTYPDAMIGWYPFGVRAAADIVQKWRPDIILASGSPMTSLLVAQKVAQRFHLPWVAELRDLWVDNHYYAYTGWRKRVETRLERKVLSTAAGLVTVSEPLAETLRAKYGKPTTVVLNGYDPDDFPGESTVPDREGGLQIVYTGKIYPGKQDPVPLFQAIAQLGSSGSKIRVCFYGTNPDLLMNAARYHGVEANIELHKRVSHHQALTAQHKADILLLLTWNDPGERGVYTGKLFEYLGAGRPILAVGLQDNVATELIHARGAGVALNEPEEIATQLRCWLEAKQRLGSLPSLPREGTLDLTREAQTRRLNAFLEDLCARA